MQLPNVPDVHLTYCLNVHPGETREDLLAAIEGPALAIRNHVSPGSPFGLGLRLGARAAGELAGADSREHLCELLHRHRLYVFTLNGFPHGQFHGTRVKEKVYQPDWRTPERRDYTLQLIEILADLLEAPNEGSISTVPGSFKAWITRPDEAIQMVHMMMDCVQRLARIREEKGKEIHLGLEPEPGCYLETSRETVAFFKELIFTKGREILARQLRCKSSRAEEIIRRHLGVCLDTCHAAVLFEDPAEALALYRAEGIRISKIQLTAAPEVKGISSLRPCLGGRDGSPSRPIKSNDGRLGEPSLPCVLEPFADDVYLHQVTAQAPDGRLSRWMDLPDALREIETIPCARVRVHSHIPLGFEEAGPLGTTSGELGSAFFSLLRKGITRHLEIETYTFHVLPPQLQSGGLVDNFRREFEWVLARI